MKKNEQVEKIRKLAKKKRKRANNIKLIKKKDLVIFTILQILRSGEETYNELWRKVERKLSQSVSKKTFNEAINELKEHNIIDERSVGQYKYLFLADDVYAPLTRFFEKAKDGLRVCIEFWLAKRKEGEIGVKEYINKVFDYFNSLINLYLLLILEYMQYPAKNLFLHEISKNIQELTYILSENFSRDEEVRIYVTLLNEGFRKSLLELAKLMRLYVELKKDKFLQEIQHLDIPEFVKEKLKKL